MEFVQRKDGVKNGLISETDQWAMNNYKILHRAGFWVKVQTLIFLMLLFTISTTSFICCNPHYPQAPKYSSIPTYSPPPVRISPRIEPLRQHKSVPSSIRPTEERRALLEKGVSADYLIAAWGKPDGDFTSECGQDTKFGTWDCRILRWDECTLFFYFVKDGVMESWLLNGWECIDTPVVVVEVPVSSGGLASIQMPGVIESRINGEFYGWDGDTLFRLTNGQIWKQSSYSYTYHYAYRPEVLIYDDGFCYKLSVEGVIDSICVERLK